MRTPVIWPFINPEPLRSIETMRNFSINRTFLILTPVFAIFLSGLWIFYEALAGKNFFAQETASQVCESVVSYIYGLKSAGGSLESDASSLQSFLVNSGIRRIKIYDSAGTLVLFYEDQLKMPGHFKQVRTSYGFPDRLWRVDALVNVRDANPAYQTAYLRPLMLLFLCSCLCIVLAVALVSVMNLSAGRKEELEKARRKQQELEELGLAAAGLAHEIKNPLGIIRGMAQRIGSDSSIDEKLRQMASDIMEESDVATARLGDFLSYARPRKPLLEPLNPKELTDRISGLVDDDFKTAGVAIVSELHDCSIMADREMLSQIVLNILMNSLKFTPSGGKVTMKLADCRDNSYILSIADTGRGIDPDIVADIFKPYVSRRPGGCGMGLAIVRKIVEQSGWDISVDSMPGKGTVIIISGIRKAVSAGT